MSNVHNLVLAAWSMANKSTKTGADGWIKGNAVCCHHRGHKADTRGRGNLKLDSDGKIVYSCFNCGYAAIYDPQSLTKKFQTLMEWMGISQDDIAAVKMAQLQKNIDGVEHVDTQLRHFFTKQFACQDLPKGSELIDLTADRQHWRDDLVTVAEYLERRGPVIANNYDFYWSPANKWHLNRRLIIPYLYRGDVVGWTARYAGAPPNNNVPRYFNSEQPTGYLFNGEAIDHPTRKYCLLFEGPLDAITCDGVGAFGSTLTIEQQTWLLSSDKEIIVVPDRQRKNQELIDTALEHEWAVSFPDWEEDIKDAADAGARYGQLYTTRSIIDSATSSALKIGILRKRFR